MPSLATLGREKQRQPVVVTKVVDLARCLRIPDTQVGKRHSRTPNPGLDGTRATVASATAFGQHQCGTPSRSEERRVGKECGSTCRSRWSPYHSKKKRKCEKSKHK